MGNRGPIHLARIFGIDLGLHWSWFLVALIEIDARSGAYHFIGWNVLEYLALFLIVTVHEFGHALATRQVGGSANRIVLWPLGGIAFVDPPPRPGPTLWAIAAGPLVNVVLALPLWLAWRASQTSLWMLLHPDAATFVQSVFFINLGLLIFNLIPVYPLDGGQILRSLLWFPLGRARSLLIAVVVGFVGVMGLGYVAVRASDWILGAIALFILWSCWGGLQHGWTLWQASKLPRHAGFRCPWCHAAPPIGTFWRCGVCQEPFDSFATSGVCPRCQAQFDGLMCRDCGRMHRLSDWTLPAPTTAAARAALAP